MQVVKYGKAYKIIFTGGKQNAQLFMHYGDNDAKIMFNAGEFQRSPERNRNHYTQVKRQKRNFLYGRFTNELKMLSNYLP